MRFDERPFMYREIMNSMASLEYIIEMDAGDRLTLLSGPNVVLKADNIVCPHSS